MGASFHSVEAIERLCIRNLLATPAERVFFKDAHGRFINVSTGWLAIDGGGRSLADVLGKTDRELFGEAVARATRADERQVISTGRPIVGKVQRQPSGAWVSVSRMPLLDDAGRVVGTFGITRDVTADIEAQADLAYRALHDPLTGLPNRIALMDRLSQAIGALERRRGCVGVLFVDLDGFKQVNDMLGHEAGDRVLREVAQRLTRSMRRVDTVARFGGDEIVLLCTDLRAPADLAIVAGRVLRSLAAPLSEGAVRLTCSVGAAATGDPSFSAADLLKRADTAMYGAKRAGGHRFELHASDFGDAVEQPPVVFGARSRTLAATTG
jgi:diguanylate cyclase (GGDEF)-like protein/PAS domain S-box-containing protein